MSNNCEEECAGVPFDCTHCSRMCEPYNYDEEKQKYVYKDLFRPKDAKGRDEIIGDMDLDKYREMVYEAEEKEEV